MTSRVLASLLGFLGLCLSLPLQANGADQIGAQSFRQPDIFRTLEGATLIHGLPALTLADPRSYSLTSAWVDIGLGPFGLSPNLETAELPQVSAPSTGRTSSPGRAPEMRLKDNYYVTGEVGFLYGRSSGGKSSLEEKSTYIIGEVGNDKVHISVGASYEEVNGRFRPQGR
jgi:hypothetical protein